MAELTVLLKFFLVQQALKGYHRCTSSIASRVPVTINILLDLILVTDTVCSPAFEASLFKVSFSVCFFGAFRISELISKSSSASNGLFYSDLVLEDACLKFLLRFSKTEQVEKGQWTF